MVSAARVSYTKALAGTYMTCCSTTTLTFLFTNQSAGFTFLRVFMVEQLLARLWARLWSWRPRWPAASNEASGREWKGKEPNVYWNRQYMLEADRTNSRSMDAIASRPSRCHQRPAASSRRGQLRAAIKSPDAQGDTRDAKNSNGAQWAQGECKLTSTNMVCSLSPRRTNEKQQGEAGGEGRSCLTRTSAPTIKQKNGNMGSEG